MYVNISVYIDHDVRYVSRHIAPVKILWNKNPVNHLETERETTSAVFHNVEKIYIKFSAHANHNALNIPKIMRSERTRCCRRYVPRHDSIFPPSSISASIVYKSTTHRTQGDIVDISLIVVDISVCCVSIYNSIATLAPHPNVTNCTWVFLVPKIVLAIHSQILSMIYVIHIPRTIHIGQNVMILLCISVWYDRFSEIGDFLFSSIVLLSFKERLGEVSYYLWKK